MKTTSYEISKQLAEAGFKSWTDFFWCELGEDLVKTHLSQSHLVPKTVKRIASYDLETILEALPSNLYIDTHTCQHFWLCWEPNSYYYYCNCNVDDSLYCHKQKDESLTDCAARLWLLLKSKNLV